MHRVGCVNQEACCAPLCLYAGCMGAYMDSCMGGMSSSAGRHKQGHASHPELVCLAAHRTDIDKALLLTSMLVSCRAMVDVLPHLAPEHLQYCFHSLEIAGWYAGPAEIYPLKQRGQSVRNLRGLLERAQQQGSDFTVAHCGYRLAAFSAKYGAWAYR